MVEPLMYFEPRVIDVLFIANISMVVLQDQIFEDFFVEGLFDLR